MKNKINNNNGIAFVMVILLLALVGSLAVAILIMNSSNINLSENATARSKAFYAAEGGVNYLDLKLNEFYKDNIKGKSIFSAEKIENELKKMQNEIKKDLKINNFDINISFDTGADKEDNIYVYEITADNGSETEKIKVEYNIEHLIDYFKYSRFANKINIENSSFYNVDDHSFATYETAYKKWSNFSSYYKDELVVHNNKAYRKISNYYAGKNIEPGNNEDDWNNHWEIDNSFKKWNKEENYKLRQKVIYNKGIYTRIKVSNEENPKDSVDWELNNPDLFTKVRLSNKKVDYNQSALPDPNDEKNEDYMEEIIKEFKKKLVEENGYTYKDEDPDDFNSWVNKRYDRGTKIKHKNKVYKAYKKPRSYRKSQPEPGVDDDWRDYWVEMNAGQDFIDNYRYYDHNDSNRGNYIYIDGDLTPNQSDSIYFSKPNEVLHILVNGEIAPNATLSLTSSKWNKTNIIIYTTAKIVSFNNAYISPSYLNLAYFAPLATYYDEAPFDGTYASAMVFNEINLKNEHPSEVITYEDDNPLIGAINPTIADLTRSFGDPNYNIENNNGPTRLNWLVE